MVRPTEINFKMLCRRIFFKSSKKASKWGSCLIFQLLLSCVHKLFLVLGTDLTAACPSGNTWGGKWIYWTKITDSGLCRKSYLMIFWMVRIVNIFKFEEIVGLIRNLLGFFKQTSPTIKYLSERRDKR